MKKGGKSSKTKVAKRAAPKSKKTVAKKKTVKKVDKKVVKKTAKKATKKVAKKAVKKAPVKKKVVKKATKKVVKKPVAKKKTVKKVVKKKTVKKATKKSSAKKKQVKKAVKKAVKKSVKKKSAKKTPNSDSKVLPSSIEDLPPPPTFEEFSEDDYSTQYTDVSQDESVSGIGYKPIQDVSMENNAPNSVEQQSEIDEQVPSMQEIEEVLGKPKKKKSFFAKLFGKKDKVESEVVTDTTNDVQVDEKLEDITHQTQHDLDSLSVENEKSAQAELDDANARQEDYVANLRRRLDMEMQERHQHVQEAHAEISDRETELEQRHQQILSREKELVKHADKYDELKSLEAQVEDRHITVEKKHQEIEQLKSELAAKEEELAAKEDELVQREQELKDKELSVEQATPEPMMQEELVEDDDDDFMYRKKEINASVTKPVVEDEPIVDVMTSKAREIHVQLQDAYTALHNSDVMGAKDIYVKVTAMYKELAQEQGQDAQLYQDILDLYKDIKLAMVQSI